MMIALATTSPTVKPIIAPLPTPLPFVSAAVLGVPVASVFVSCIVDSGLSEDIAVVEEAANDNVVVDDSADATDDSNVTDSLATSSRARYQLVLQNPPLVCSSAVPWALTTLKTNGFVRFVSLARTSHWYQSVAQLA